MNSHILVQDYIRLCKPKIVLLITVTALVGMVLSSPDALIPLHVLLFGTSGIALCAASAAIMNHLLDKKIDKKMRRTQSRPVAQERISHNNALLFSCIIGTIGFAILYLQINPLTAWLTLFALIGYGVLYTLFLKRATPQNIVIGGLSGAAPPLLGWVAVTGMIEPHALLLVLIIFLWTPPHFWALAVYRYDDYVQSGLPMLPVTHGIQCTRMHIMLYSLLMVLACYLVYLVGFAGNVYVVWITVLNVRFCYFVYQLYQDEELDAYNRLFWYSVRYLWWLFAALLLDKIYSVLMVSV